MARTESESEFDKLVAANETNLMTSRGAASQFRPIEASEGSYHAVIVRMFRTTQDQTIYDDKGKATNQKQKVGLVKALIVIVADAGKNCPREHLEQFAGVQGYLQWRLTPGKQDDWDRLSADLASMGVPTRMMVPSEHHIQQPGQQFTLGQALELINRPYPKGQFGILVQVSISGNNKYTNYRDVIRREDIEQLIGHQINPAYFNVQAEAEKPVQQMDMSGAGQYGAGAPQPGMGVVAPAPISSVVSHGPVQPHNFAQLGRPNTELVWDAENKLWFHPPTTNFYDQNGNFASVRNMPVAQAPAPLPAQQVQPQQSYQIAPVESPLIGQQVYPPVPTSAPQPQQGYAPPAQVGYPAPPPMPGYPQQR